MAKGLLAGKMYANRRQDVVTKNPGFGVSAHSPNPTVFFGHREQRNRNDYQAMKAYAINLCFPAVL
jgi:hypothetical protein